MARRPSLWWQIFKVAATYVGTVVGAGFASGQETLRFFGAYGRAGLMGIGVATLLFCLFGIQVMELGRRLNARSHREVLHYIGGPRLGKAMDLVITLFLGATLTVMVAGGGAVFAEQMRLPHAVGTVLTAVISGLTILAGMRGIMAANAVVVPLLTTAVVGLSLTSIRFHGLNPILANTIPWPFLAPVRSWFAASWLYVAYNLVLSISVLAPLGSTIKDRRALIGGGLVGGLSLGILATGIKLAISAHMPDIGLYEVPMLFLARLHSPPVQWFYTLILWAEIYTTAIATAYGFASRAADVVHGSYRGTVIIVTALALMASGIGFSRLVGFLYPLFGGLALVVLLCLGRAAVKPH
ncbi:MAG: hypothetical protein ACM3XM_15470 [Mycobacterium leprae]